MYDPTSFFIYFIYACIAAGVAASNTLPSIYLSASGQSVNSNRFATSIGRNSLADSLYLPSCKMGYPSQAN